MRFSFHGNGLSWLGVLLTSAAVQAQAVPFVDDFGPASRGPLADNPIQGPPLNWTTPVPRGYRPVHWTSWDTRSDALAGFWVIPEGQTYLEQAGRSSNPALFASTPVPSGQPNYDIAFRQYRSDNDYIGYIIGATGTTPSSGVEFGYEAQLPGTDTNSDDAYYEGALGTGIARGMAFRRQWADHRIEVRGTHVRWLINATVVTEGDVPGLPAGGYFGIRQTWERGTRYDDVSIALSSASLPPSPPPGPGTGSGTPTAAAPTGPRPNREGTEGCGATGMETVLLVTLLAAGRRLRRKAPSRERAR